MISVQNHRLLSNGNKLSFVLIFVSLFFFSSCDLFQKASTGDNKKIGETLPDISGKKVFNPETGQWEVVESLPLEKMDTIAWKEITEDDYPPITDDGEHAINVNPVDVLNVDEIGSEKLSSYNVTLMLPFLTNRFNSGTGELYENSLWAVNFYGGAKMALEKLNAEGVQLNISVLDSKASPSVVSSLLKNNADVLNSHLIIGPYRRDNVRLVAEYAKRKDITFVSPQSASSSITSANSNYIQVNPTLETHCQSIMKDILENYRADQVVLVSKVDEKEKSRLNYFKDAYRGIEGAAADTKPLQELIIADESYSLEDVDLMPFIELQDTTVFVIPSWQETFVYALLRKIEVSKMDYNHIVVYGMPQWLDFDKIDYDYYEKLNVRVTSGTFIDPLSAEGRRFKQAFFDKYGSIATQEAYLGYDVMLYFGRKIHQYGTKFQYYIEQEPLESTLLTKYSFKRVVSETGDNFKFMNIDRFENKYVNLLEFEDYQFQLKEN